MDAMQCPGGVYGSGIVTAYNMALLQEPEYPVSLHNAGMLVHVPVRKYARTYVPHVVVHYNIHYRFQSESNATDTYERLPVSY